MVARSGEAEFGAGSADLATAFVSVALSHKLACAACPVPSMSQVKLVWCDLRVRWLQARGRAAVGRLRRASSRATQRKLERLARLPFTRSLALSYTHRRRLAPVAPPTHRQSTQPAPPTRLDGPSTLPLSSPPPEPVTRSTRHPSRASPSRVHSFQPRRQHAHGDTRTPPQPCTRPSSPSPPPPSLSRAALTPLAPRAPTTRSRQSTPCTASATSACTTSAQTTASSTSSASALSPLAPLGSLSRRGLSPSCSASLD